MPLGKSTMLPADTSAGLLKDAITIKYIGYSMTITMIVEIVYRKKSKILSVLDFCTLTPVIISSFFFDISFLSSSLHSSHSTLRVTTCRSFSSKYSSRLSEGSG